MERNFQVEITPPEVKKRLWIEHRISGISSRTEKDLHFLLEESKKWIKPKTIFDIFPSSKNGRFIVGGETLSGNLPARVFKKTQRVGLFVTTIGPELEENEKRYPQRMIPVIEAIGSAAQIKAVLHVHREWIDPVLKEKESNLPTVRLYPGVGDWLLQDQKIIFRLLGEKSIKELIGVKLTSGCMLIPRKSMSVMVGSKTKKAARL